MSVEKDRLQKMAARVGSPNTRWEAVVGRVLKHWATAIMKSQGVTRSRARELLLNRLIEESGLTEVPVTDTLETHVG